MNKKQENQLLELMQKYPNLFALLGTMERFKGKYDLPTILENLDIESNLMIGLEIMSGGLDEIKEFSDSLKITDGSLSDDENKIVDNILSFLNKGK